jgi:hypothetical protein
MPYAIMRFKKRKQGAVGSCRAHNERTKKAYLSNAKIDPGRSKDNYHVGTPPDMTYAKMCRRRFDETGARPKRADAVWLVETLVTASPEFIKALPAEEEIEYFERAYRFLASEVGEANIVSAVVHKDETTPHMHLCFVPVTRDGRLSAKDILGNQKSLSGWQDRFHEAMSERWPELQRGISAMVTHRSHLPVWLFKSAERLDAQLADVSALIGGASVFSYKKQNEEAQRLLREWMPEAQKFTAQIKTLDGEIASLRKAKKDLSENQSWREQCLESELDEMRKRLDRASVEFRKLRDQMGKQKSLLDKIPDSVKEECIQRAEKKNREEPER